MNNDHYLFISKLPTGKFKLSILTGKPVMLKGKPVGMITKAILNGDHIVLEGRVDKDAIDEDIFPRNLTSVSID